MTEAQSVKVGDEVEVEVEVGVRLRPLAATELLALPLALALPAFVARSPGLLQHTHAVKSNMAIVDAGDDEVAVELRRDLVEKETRA